MLRQSDAKWLRGEAPADEPFIGSADIQSLADLGNSLEVVRAPCQRLKGMALIQINAVVCGSDPFGKSTQAIFCQKE